MQIIPITLHFAYHEFAQPARRGFKYQNYPEEWVETRLKPLCLELEIIRTLLDEPIFIISGYRSFEYNNAVGGAQQSQHLVGMAADIAVRNLVPWRLYSEILELYRQKKLYRIRGLGLYDTHVHVDIREKQRMSTWDLRKSI